MRIRDFVILIVATTSLLALSSQVLADGPEVHVLTGAELLSSPEFTAASGGRLRVSVFRVRAQSWSARVEEGRLLLRLEDEDDEAAEGAAWEDLGEVSLRARSRYRLTIERPVDEEDDEPRPLPALVVVSTPDFAVDRILDITRSRTNTIEPEDDFRRTEVRTNQEGVDFTPPETVNAWRERAAQVRAQLMVTLGQWPELPRGPVRATVVGTIERDDYVIEKVLLETLSGLYVSGNLYRPREVKGRLPFVLSPHGHWQEGRLNVEVQQRCIGLAKLGCLAFMYDMVGYNDSKPFGHSFHSPRLKRWGFSLAALQTWNSRRVLDWALSRPDVDPSRVACTGESGGGTQTFLLTAIDDRVKVSAPVVMVSEGFQGGCECENTAGLRWETDNVEFAALCAPRPLKLVGATGDWTSNTTSAILPTLRNVYGLFGVPDRISADVFTAPHNYNQTSRNAVYAFLGHWLLGIDDPLKTVEGPQSADVGTALLTIDEQHPAPEGVKSPSDLEEFLIAQRSEAIGRLRPSTFPADWEAARTQLARIHAVRVGQSGFAPVDVGYREIRRADRDGIQLAHGVVERGDPAESVPVIRIERDGARRTVVLAHESGKANLIGPDGELSHLVLELLDAGFRVIAFDPLLAGESFDSASPAARRPETVHYDTYNRSLAVDRIRDLESVIAWASKLPDVLAVDIVASGQMSPLTLLALPRLDSVGCSLIDLAGFDYGDGGGAIPEALDLPGVLQFGGLPVALALAAPRPVVVFRPKADFERMWAVNGYALGGAAAQVKFVADAPDTAAIVQWLTEAR